MKRCYRNNTRGIRVCDAISRHCDLHLFNRPSAGSSVIRLRFSGADLNSNRVRTAEESRALRSGGGAICGYQLQGHLSFISAEAVLRDVIERAAEIEYCIMDFKRVLSINESACRLFHALLKTLSEAGKNIVFTHTARFPLVRRYMKTKLGGEFSKLFRPFDDDDQALEWCEDQLLGEVLEPAGDGDAAGYELLENFTEAQTAALAKHFQRRNFKEGETLINAGDEAREMFFITRGRASVFVPVENDGRKRLATFSAGMVFGEMAFIDRAPRSANIVADSEMVCDVLTLRDFDQLGESQPALKIKLLENLSLCLCRRLRTANRKLSVFD